MSHAAISHDVWSMTLASLDQPARLMWRLASVGHLRVDRSLLRDALLQSLAAFGCQESSAADHLASVLKGGGRGALHWLDLVHEFSAWGVVAGSAALFLEMVCSGLRPTWTPGDIDVWVDLDDAKQAALEESRWRWPCGARVRSITDRGVSVQVMLQRPWLGRIGHESNWVHQRIGHCSCQRPRMACVRCLPMFDFGLGSGYYNFEWPVGNPHFTFDLDIVSVCLRRVGGVYTFDRLCGDPASDNMCLRPAANWKCNLDRYSDKLSIVPHHGRTTERVRCYEGRGWALVSNPDEFVLCTFAPSDAARV
jgi:hypothetical protein